MIGGVSIEMKKTRSYAALAVSGVVSIEELGAERITLATHHGRLVIAGERLLLSVLEDRCAEVLGRIKGVEFSYGRA